MASDEFESRIGHLRYRATKRLVHGVVRGLHRLRLLKHRGWANE